MNAKTELTMPVTESLRWAATLVGGMNVQIRPLLPGNPDCVALVTSRDRLDALVALDGARRLDLDVLPLGDAIALLAQLTGESRVRAEPTAAAEV